MQEKKTGKSIKQKALVSLVVICALVMAGFVGRWAYGETQGDSDAITYRAKDQTAALGTRENPFTVLELVPDRSMAAVGYLIPGCEPVNNLENDVTGTRVLYERCFASGEDGIVSVLDTVAVVFWPDRPDLGISNEEMKNLTFYDDEDAAKEWGPPEGVPEENILSAGQYGYFEHAPGSTGAYIYVPAGQEESGDQEADPAQPQDPDQGADPDQPADPDQGVDQEQEALQGYFKAKTVDDEMPEGQITYNWVPLQLFSEVKGEIVGPDVYVREGDTYTDRELKPGEKYMSFEWPRGVLNEGVKYYVCRELVDNLDAQLPKNNKDVTMKDGEIGTETDLEGMRYYQYRCEPRSFCYSKGKIQHKDQLIQTLFPGQSSAGGFVSQVVTVTPEQLNRNRDDSAMAVIRDADMIVIHDSQVAKAVNEQASLSMGGQAATLTKFWEKEKDDINNDIFQALVKKQASGNPAMMLLDESAMDECVTMQADTANPKHQRSNLEKLYTVLNKYGAKRYYNVYCKDTDKDWEYDPGQNGSDVFTYTDHIRADHAKGLHTHMGVAGYVCNWDGDDALLSRLIKDQDTLTAFGGMYQEAAAIGYKDTLNILELHPAVPNTADGKKEADVQKLWNEYYTSRGYRGWRDYYLSLCPWFVGRDADIAAADESGVSDITVTRKATYEFNGDIEDLNAVYDMIVIGSYQDDSCGLNGYNDTTMGNLAYTTVGDMMDNYKGQVYLNKTGDLVYSGYEDWDLHENGMKYGAADTKSSKGTEFYQSNIRYSGTDVTAKKFEELVEFCQKDLIVVDGSLYKGGGAGKSVNDGLVDKNSLLHVIAGIALHSDNQVQHVATTQDAAARRQYVGKILCHMAFSDNGSGENGRPVTYAYTTTDGRDDGVIAHSNYNTQIDDNNHNVLQYHFTLEGEASAPYEAAVYIDSDGNGYFEEDERTDYRNLIVQDNTPGERNRLLDLNRESLVAGHTYTVTRVLPDAEQGILPWKLVTYVKGNPSIRDSATGLTRVKSRLADRETIHVLQMNLHTQMKNIYNKTDNAGDSKDGDWASDPTNLANPDNKVGKQFRDYLKGVEDYDVRLTYMTNQDWMARFNGKPEEWKAYLLGENGETGVDMLVLGFRDSATFTNNATYIEGFKAFVAADRAVILSHDMVQDKSFAYGGWGKTAGDYTYTLNNAMYLRNLSAQQKKYYYVDLQAQKIKHAYAYTYSHGNKISLAPNEDLSLYYDSKVLSAVDYRYQVPGTMQYAGTLMDNPVRAMIKLNNLLLDKNYKLDRLLDTKRVRGEKSNANKSFAWTYAARTDTVKTANEGQITAYPYDIPEQISVATTHVQNYKLDLEEGMPGAAANIRFNIDGDFSDWDDVPHTSNSYNTIGYPNESTGCLVGDTLYVHTKAFNSSNGSAFNYMEVTLTDSNGKKKTCGTHLITGTGPDHYVSGELWGGLEDGIYHYEIICSGSWNSGAYKDSPDCVFGEAYVKVENGVSEIEYKVDMNKFVSHTQGHWGEDLEVVFDENATLTLWQSTVGPEVIPVLKDDGSANQAPVVPQIEFQEGQLYQRNNTGTAAIVWYNLSGGRDVGSKNNYTTNIYSAREGDSANNYYIYTKENITYTGFGHNVSLKYGPEAITSEEVRLFINTMISAYRSKTSAPYLTVTNPDVVNNSVYSTLYMEERDILADTANVDVHLTLRDDSIDINRNKVYHITVKDTAGNEVRISGWGNYDEATHSYIGVKGGNYTIPVSLKDMMEDPSGMKTYVLETYATYESNGSVKMTPSSKRIVRVMRKPLFGLH